MTNNNATDIAFVVHMWQSNKCGDVRNDEIINLQLWSCVDSWVSLPYLLEDTSLIYWFHPPKQSTRKKQNSEMTSNSQKIILYCFGLCTKNPVLREVDLEPSPKNLVDQQTLRYFCIKQYVSACIESGKIFSSWDFFQKSFLFWKVFEWHQTIQEYGIYKWKIAK